MQAAARTASGPSDDVSKSQEPRASSIACVMDAPLQSPAAILVPHVGGMQQGSKLVGEVHVGRLLGSGMQV